MTYQEEVRFQEGWIAAVRYFKDCFRPGIDSKDEFVEKLIEIYREEMEHLLTRMVR